jgi:integrase
MAGGTKPIRLAGRLDDRQVRAFITKGRAGQAATKKLADGGGLYLTLTAAGSPVWRLKYRWDGKEKLLALGHYPEVTLAEARDQRDRARAQLRDHKDPSIVRQLSKMAAVAAADSTFGALAETWLEKSRKEWSVVHYDKSRRAFARDVLPSLGRLPIAEITASMIVSVVLPVANRGARDTAGRILQHIGSIFRYAEGLGLCERDPTPSARAVLPKAEKGERYAAILDPIELREIIRRADLAPISPVVRMAHRLCAFTVNRLGNVVTATWDQFQLEGNAPVWSIPRKLMKSQTHAHDHRTFLGPTITADLRHWRSLSSGSGYLFPSEGASPFITREAVEKMYRRTLGLAGRHTPHGWRSSFSTLAREQGFSRDPIELQLDHKSSEGAVSAAYNRSELLEERRKLMAWWDALLTGATS